MGSHSGLQVSFFFPSCSHPLQASQGQRSFSAATAAAAGTEHEGKPQHHRRGPTVTDMVGGTGLEQNFTDDEAHISGAVYSPPETAADWHGTSPGVSAAEAEAMSARNRATQAAAWASSAKSPADSAAVSADDPAISGTALRDPWLFVFLYLSNKTSQH